MSDEYGIPNEVANGKKIAHVVDGIIGLRVSRAAIGLILLLVSAGGTITTLGINRLFTSLDTLQGGQIQAVTKLGEVQNSVTNNMADVKASVITLKGQVDVINQHFSDVTKLLNDRVDAQGNWLKTNSDNIDKLRDRISK